MASIGGGNSKRSYRFLSFMVRIQQKTLAYEIHMLLCSRVNERLMSTISTDHSEEAEDIVDGLSWSGSDFNHTTLASQRKSDASRDFCVA